jgi:DNA polymerase-3 subunit delta'
MFENFFGNAEAVQTLEAMLQRERIPQTLLLHGPEGVGKATLARRFAARLLGGREKIEQDDLSLPGNQAILAEREKWAPEKRADDPLFFGTHPDFLTFPPDGPLRQLSIQQMRALREKAQRKPLHGRHRVFLIDHLDRANEQAANSLLKTLEEPPEYLILISTAENAYDLLPTIRSRSLPIRMAPLDEEAMRAFAAARGLSDAERRIAIAGGSPGAAVALDLEQYAAHRTAMLVLLQAAAGQAGFGAWVKHSEAISAKGERLEPYLKVLYLLLEDLLQLQHGGTALRNADLRNPLESLAGQVGFDWIRQAVQRTDELLRLLQRNIQKGVALDAMVLGLRP